MTCGVCVSFLNDGFAREKGPYRAMPADDNRSKQLNPQHPAYYLSRGLTAVAAAAAAAVATGRNQEAKRR